MAGDIVLGVRLTADASGLRGELKLSREDLDRLVNESHRTGRRGAPVDRCTADQIGAAARQALRRNFGLRRQGRA